MGKAIAISRQHSCGGLELGKALAESLGYEYIDKSIVVGLAEKMKTSGEDGGYLSLFKFINKFTGESTAPTIVSQSKDLASVNSERYRADVVYARVVSPMEYKKRFLASKASISLQEAGTIIKAKEEERRNYYEEMFNGSSTDPRAQSCHCQHGAGYQTDRRRNDIEASVM